MWHDVVTKCHNFHMFQLQMLAEQIFMTSKKLTKKSALIDLTAAPKVKMAKLSPQQFKWIFARRRLGLYSIHGEWVSCKGRNMPVRGRRGKDACRKCRCRDSDWCPLPSRSQIMKDAGMTRIQAKLLRKGRDRRFSVRRIYNLEIWNQWYLQT